jgi:hypothetical protein
MNASTCCVDDMPFDYATKRHSHKLSSSGHSAHGPTAVQSGCSKKRKNLRSDITPTGSFVESMA